MGQSSLTQTRSGTLPPPNAKPQFAPLTLALAQAQAVWTPLLTEAVQSVHRSTLIVQNAGTCMCAPSHRQRRARPFGGCAATSHPPRPVPGPRGKDTGVG